MNRELLQQLVGALEQVNVAMPFPVAMELIKVGRAELDKPPKEPEGWISVDDRLPSFKKDVLVFCEDTSEQFVAFNVGDGQFQYATDQIGVPIVCSPTYWMPLPPPPSIKETKG